MASTLAVLAGGEGRRMGEPKDLLLAAGQPVLTRLLERMAWTGPTLLVAPFGDRFSPGHEMFSEVVRDAVAGQGPLRGILTALERAPTDEVVIIPVDMPALSHEHAVWISRQLAQRPNSAGVMPVRTFMAGPRIEPFPCAFRQAAAPVIRDRLAAGLLAVHAISALKEVEQVVPPENWGDSVWSNVNTPEDLPPDWSRSAR